MQEILGGNVMPLGLKLHGKAGDDLFFGLKASGPVNALLEASETVPDIPSEGNDSCAIW